MLIIFLYIALGIFVYAVCGGFTYRAAEMSHRSKCNRCSSKQGDRTCADVPELGWFFASLAWVITLPVVLGMKLHGDNEVKATRQERRHIKEIRQAEHMSKLASLRLQEAQALQEASELTEPHNILSILSKA